jgi:GT2 family glycosyltransferase
MGAKGKYIVFVSDDDRIAPWMLERCMALVNREPQIPIILALGDQNEEGRTWQAAPNRKFGTGIWEGTDLLLEYFKGNIVPDMCSIMFRTDALRTIGGFPIDLPNFGADTAVWVSLLLKGRAGLVNEACATCFKHNATESSSLTMEERLNHGRTLIDFIKSMAKLSIDDSRRCRQVEVGAQVFFARQLISALCHLRRKGCKISEVRRFIWRWRRDLRHIGVVEIFRLARKIAVIVCPQLTAWIRHLMPPHGVSNSPGISGNG